ncbi:MAG TPA: DUF6779 domain-containing protein, partial [Nakamurella sp.]
MRILLGVGFVLALVATALVVFAEDVKLLRLAAVLALWVALIAAFAIARSRRDTRSAERRQEEIRLAYEIELHREIAARAEYEAGLGRQLEAAQADQLDGLRGEIDRLASALSRLLDGDLLIERVTLSAESIRVRAIGDTGGDRSGRVATGAVAALESVSADVPGGPNLDPHVVDGLDDPGRIDHGLANADGLQVEAGPADATPPARDGVENADEQLVVGVAIAADDETPVDVETPTDVESAPDVEPDVDWTVDEEALPDMPSAPGAPDADGAAEPDGAQGFSGAVGSYTLDHDDHPTLPLPTVERTDAPATGWTWSHRASSPVPVSAPPHTPVPVAASATTLANPAILDQSAARTAVVDQPGHGGVQLVESADLVVGVESVAPAALVESVPPADLVESVESIRPAEPLDEADGWPDAVGVGAPESSVV